MTRTVARPTSPSRRPAFLTQFFPQATYSQMLLLKTQVHTYLYDFSATYIHSARVTFDKIVPYHRSIRDFGVVKAGKVFPSFRRHTATELVANNMYSISTTFIFKNMYHISHYIHIFFLL